MKAKFSGVIFVSIILFLIIESIISCVNQTKPDNTSNTEDYPCGITEEYADSLKSDTIIKTDIDGNVYEEY